MLQLLLSVAILVADIYAILVIMQTSARIEQKTVWIVIVLVLPILGVAGWYFAGPGGKNG